ncbi:TYR [Ectocarpus sp. CCAP 1310/34]|nr:TYR [Ectocarpus sp. CCAP 1310/34]
MPPQLGSHWYGSVGDPAKAAATPPAEGGEHPFFHEGDDGKPRRGLAKVGLALALALGVAATSRAGVHTAAATRSSSSSSTLQSSVDNKGRETSHRPGLATTAPPPLAFHARNFYHVRDGKPASDYPWLRDVKLVEPHRETTLSVDDPREGFEYRWLIRGGSSASKVHTAASGAEAVVVLEAKHLEENLVTLEEVEIATGAVARRLDEFVMVKYVRREIRTLTYEEREELLDAMLELWNVRVQDGDGREKYGENYSDIWAINRLHFKAASPQFCDHFHDGLGFLTNHGLVSNTFENSLQQVNPKLTLPYWDFTIESSTAGIAANEHLDDMFGSKIKTPLLQESWFGTADPTTRMVQNGRWANVPIPKMREGNPSKIEPDVYSKLRSPWNVNDRRYISRGMGQMCHARAETFYPWPTCESHYNLATSFTDFYSWVWESLYDPHGPVHIWIGGVMDCEETYGVDIEHLVGEETALDLALMAFVHRKDMFRDGIFSCEGSVAVTESPDEVLESGVCGCHGYDLTQGDDYLQIFESMVFMKELMGDSDENTKRELVRVMCSTPINEGDHLQSSSSLDPSFWSTHPTMERLWMYSVLTGQVTDFEWPDADVTYTASDGTTYSQPISKYSEECLGHRGSDVFPFDILANEVNDFTVQTGIKGSPLGGGNTMTNREVLAAFDPRINALPYVYDTFEWAHCAEDGFDLRDAWLAKGDEEASRGEGPGGQAMSAKKGPRAVSRQSIGGGTVFEKDDLPFPMYGTLKDKMAHLKARKESPAGR